MNRKSVGGGKRQRAPGSSAGAPRCPAKQHRADAAPRPTAIVRPPVAVSRSLTTLQLWMACPATRDNLLLVQNALETRCAAARQAGVLATVSLNVPVASPAAMLQCVHRCRRQQSARDTAAPSVGLCVTVAPLWRTQQTFHFCLADGRPVVQTTCVQPPDAAAFGRALRAAAHKAPQCVPLLRRVHSNALSADDAYTSFQAVRGLLGSAQEASVTPCLFDATAVHCFADTRHGEPHSAVYTQCAERATAVHHIGGMDVWHTVSRPVKHAAIPSVVAPHAVAVQQELLAEVAWDGHPVHGWRVLFVRRSEGGNMHAAEQGLATGAVACSVQLQYSAPPTVRLNKEAHQRAVQCGLRVIQYILELVSGTQS